MSYRDTQGYDDEFCSECGESSLLEDGSCMNCDGEWDDDERS